MCKEALPVPENQTSHSSLAGASLTQLGEHWFMRTLTVGARRIFWSGLLLLVTAIIAGPAQAQNQELTFSLGGIPGQSRTFQNPGGTAQISADRSFGINYGHRFLSAGIAALYGEIEFAAIPNRSISASNATVAQNYASLYVTPGFTTLI